MTGVLPLGTPAARRSNAKTSAPARFDLIEPSLLAASRSAALACVGHVGRGAGACADRAATDAMRAALAEMPAAATVVIGEGEKDDAPMLFNGERFGTEAGPGFDLAVDPLECTDLCARGLAGSLTTIACAPAGALWSPGPAHYMDKLVVGAGARGAVDVRDAPERNLARIARALGRALEELRVFVLDKPRHRELIARIRAAGAITITPTAGDVAGAVLAAMPGGAVDVLMGVGGTPEGILAACAVSALGGEFQGRLAPQSCVESERVAVAGIDTERVLVTEDLVDGPSVFAATGVTGGDLLRAPWERDGRVLTESLLVRDGSVRWIVEAS